LSPDEQGRVLACGIDSLSVSLQVEWQTEELFEKLTGLKAAAKSNHEDQPGIIKPGYGSTPWLFLIAPSGSNGYEWVLKGRELTMRIGNWTDLKQRPSVVADFRSETLWAHGSDMCIQRLQDLIKAMHGKVVSLKPSRVDVCADVLIREADWVFGLIDGFVTRARDINPHFQSRALSGFSIGKGATSARLYDKPREIRVKSKKYWMYDIWGIESVAEDHQVIRVEYQLRREALHEMGIETYPGLVEQLAGLWAYLTRKWLRVVDDASLHHTQQVVRPWWHVIEGGFADAQQATPIVREKAISTDLKRHEAQLMGLVSSITALQRQGMLIAGDESLDVASHIAVIIDMVRKNTRVDDEQFTERVKRKQAKQLRAGVDFSDAPGAKPAGAVSSRRTTRRGLHLTFN
jgi:hypothetical protein